jgi:hypothetical protein
MQMSTYDDSFRRIRVHEDSVFLKPYWDWCLHHQIKSVRQALLEFKDTNTLNYVYLLRKTITEKLYK